MIRLNGLGQREVVPNFNRWGRGFRRSKPWAGPYTWAFPFIVAPNPPYASIANGYNALDGSLRFYAYGNFFQPGGQPAVAGPAGTAEANVAALGVPITGGPVNGYLGGKLFNRFWRNNGFAVRNV